MKIVPFSKGEKESTNSLIISSVSESISISELAGFILTNSLSLHFNRQEA